MPGETDDAFSPKGKPKRPSAPGLSICHRLLNRSAHPGERKNRCCQQRLQDACRAPRNHWLVGRGISTLCLRLAPVSRRDISIPQRREHGVTLLHVRKGLTWHEAHSPQLSDPRLALRSLQVSAWEKALLDGGGASQQDPLETGDHSSDQYLGGGLGTGRLLCPSSHESGVQACSSLW